MKINYNGKSHTVDTIDFGVGFEKTFLFGDMFGPTHLVQADTFDEAFDEYLDNAAPIPDYEVHEAYGLESREELTDEAELAEGYHYQPNSVGSGIVYLDHYHWQRKVTIDALVVS